MPPNPPQRLSRGGESPHGVVRGGSCISPPSTSPLLTFLLPTSPLPFSSPPQPPAGMGTPLREGVLGGDSPEVPPCTPRVPARGHPGPCTPWSVQPPPPRSLCNPPSVAGWPQAPCSMHEYVCARRCARVCLQLDTRVPADLHTCACRCTCMHTHVHTDVHACGRTHADAHACAHGSGGLEAHRGSPKVFSPPPALQTPPPALPLPIIAALTVSTVIISLSSPGSHRQGLWYQQGWGASAGCEGGDIAGMHVRVETK